MGRKKKKNLRERLNRYHAKPDSAAYRECHAEAVAAGIRLPSRDWPFPDPVAADDGAAAAAARATPPQPGGGGGRAEPDPASGDDDSERDVATRELRFESPVKKTTLKKRKERANARVELAKKVKVADAHRQDAEARALEQRARRRAKAIRDDFADDDDGTLMTHTLIMLGRDRVWGAAMMQTECMYPVATRMLENARAFLKNFPTRTAADRRLKLGFLSGVVGDSIRRGRERARLRPARRDHHRGHPDGRGEGARPEMILTLSKEPKSRVANLYKLRCTSLLWIST